MNEHVMIISNICILTNILVLLSNLNPFNSTHSSQCLFTLPVLTLHLPHSTFSCLSLNQQFTKTPTAGQSVEMLRGCQNTNNMVIRARRQQQFNVSRVHSLETCHLPVPSTICIQTCLHRLFHV